MAIFVVPVQKKYKVVVGLLFAVLPTTNENHKVGNTGSWRLSVEGRGVEERWTKEPEGKGGGRNERVNLEEVVETVGNYGGSRARCFTILSLPQRLLVTRWKTWSNYNRRQRGLKTSLKTEFSNEESARPHGRASKQENAKVQLNFRLSRSFR